MKVYISGPMTGYIDYNFPEFNRVAAALREKGYEVINPAEIETEDKTWEGFMRADIKQLMDADMIATLDGWTYSKGARIEVKLGENLGMEIVSARDLLEQEVSA